MKKMLTWLLLLAITAMLLYGIGLLGQRIYIFATYERVDGVIVDYWYKSHSGNTLIVETEDGRRVYGKVYTRSKREGRAYPGDPLGDQVKVLSNPADPEDAYILTFRQFWAMPLGFGGAGVLVLVIGLGILFGGIEIGDND